MAGLAEGEFRIQGVAVAGEGVDGVEVRLEGDRGGDPGGQALRGAADAQIEHWRQHGLAPERARGFLVVRIGVVAPLHNRLGMPSSIGGTPRAVMLAPAIHAAAEAATIASTRNLAGGHILGLEEIHVAGRSNAIHG